MGIYLAGPILNCQDAQCNDWRDYVTKQVENTDLAMRFRVLNPMDRDYRLRYNDSSVVPEVIQLDKRDINNSDVLFANIIQYSAGTSMEVLYAWERDKVVVCVVPRDTTLSPWIVYHSTKLVYSLDEGIEWISKFVR
jgi:nucleoside 2-deoxyribosyltransferase